MAPMMNSPRTTRADLNGASFAYETAGPESSGAWPIVFIHAGIADSRMWGDSCRQDDTGDAHHGQFSTLAASFAVVRYDLRGFGRTPPAPGPYAHHADLLALMDHLAIGRAALVGCSLGSRTALDFALQFPERIDRLVLMSPAVSGLTYDGPPSPQAAELIAADDAGDLARVNELEIQIWVDGPHRSPGEVDPRVRRLALEMNAIALANEGVGEERPLQPPAAERPAEVRAPVLVIAGELDTARTLASADWLVENLPDARLALVPGAAHLPNMEEPERVNRLLLDFLG